MKNVLVTGAAGFIGRHLINKLDIEGHTYIGLHRTGAFTGGNGRQPNILPDISLTTLLNGIDVVIHLAGAAHVSRKAHEANSEIFKTNNEALTDQVLDAAIHAGVPRFIFLSSIGVNGAQTTTTPFRASDIPAPKTSYAQSKLNCELAIQRKVPKGPLRYVIIRPPLVYGANAPGNFGRLMNYVQKGFPCPFASVTENRRSLISVYNLVDFIFSFVEKFPLMNKVYTVSDNEDISTAQLFEKMYSHAQIAPTMLKIPEKLISSIAGIVRQKSIKEQLLASLQVDITETINELGWRPALTVDEALSKVFANDN